MSATLQTIALVEDDASLSRALARLLRASGFETRTFASAEEFLASESPGAHACLILDIHLPGISGLELLDQLNASGPPRQAIFITASDDEGARERAGRIPGGVYLLKPVNGAVLLEAVRTLLSRAPNAGPRHHESP